MRTLGTLPRWQGGDAHLPLILPALALVHAAACSRREELPAVWSAPHRDPVADSIQVWRHGPDSFEDPELPAFGEPAGPFAGIDERVGTILRWPSLNPPFRLTCAGLHHAFGDALAAALEGPDALASLQTLTVLPKVRASASGPNSVPLPKPPSGRPASVCGSPPRSSLLAPRYFFGGTFMSPIFFSTMRWVSFEASRRSRIWA